jgi:flagellar M-ring protein FliF
MDFLNKAYAQLSDLFRSMTPGARVTSGLLLAVVVTSLGYLFTRGVAGPDAYLMDGRPFRPEQIDAMEAAFAKAGLSSYKREGSQIRIPYGEEHKYMGALAENNALPRDFGEIRERALGGGPFESSDKFKARMKIADQQECSEILKGISWVADAAVMWDEKVKQGFGKENVITASASILPKGSESMNNERVQSIRLAVTAFRAGLKPENVTVMDQSTGHTYHGGDSDIGTAFDDPYASRKRMYEEQWRAEILRALAYFPNVTVAVNVKLDPKRRHHQQEVKNDPKTVAVQVLEKNRSKSQEGAGPAGRPGFSANQPGALAPAAGKGPRQEEEESETNTFNARSGMTQEIENQGLIPQQVSATIGIPMSYLRQLWREQNPPDPKAPATEPPKTPSKEELEQIRQRVSDQILGYVLPLIPDVEGMADKKQLVRVDAFYDIAPSPIPEEEITQKALTWLGESWKTLGMILVVLVSLVMLRSMINAAPIVRENKMLPVAARKEPEAASQEAAESEAARRLRRFQGGTSLKDELSVLVNEDPDAAANILRTWIGHPV